MRDDRVLQPVVEREVDPVLATVLGPDHGRQKVHDAPPQSSGTILSSGSPALRRLRLASNPDARSPIPRSQGGRSLLGAQRAGPSSGREGHEQPRPRPLTAYARVEDRVKATAAGFGSTCQSPSSPRSCWPRWRAWPSDPNPWLANASAARPPRPLTDFACQRGGGAAAGRERRVSDGESVTVARRPEKTEGRPPAGPPLRVW